MSGALITGGAGFVGTNLADRLLSAGERVVVLDNLSRWGVEQNLRWLQERHGGSLGVEVDDVTNRTTLRRALRGVDSVFHLAGQVAVTTSLTDPEADARTNVNGTLALLEEMRRLDDPPPLLFTSTNKVYGGLEDVALVETHNRYDPRDPHLLRHGVDESRPLCFCTPYGCSKGAADQYVLDYAHSYGLSTVVLRMSCIYGPHQFGTEDQGWVAHFLIRALAGEPITVYGDGKQVRDVLFVDDLVDAFLRAESDADRLRGRAFNIGGGASNCISLLELVEMIGELTREPPDVEVAPWRQGDQRYYVSDTASFRDATGWRPEVGPEDGVARLFHWLLENRADRAPALGTALA